ncbi:Uncharacterized ATP-dependent helicase MJ0104 [Geodia barretti]|uniref:Uncharacterized ATP-dependent helicase MJ0104 n=1 Tax=Geodia barretti TaxID=519541 RepID=A0AA35ST76_GEOBA|nr:Uncharacterized ATP-dependent helicase MJ0104 [Geodia barretti]
MERLKTDPSVMRRQSGLNLTHFWPKHDSPIVFCQVEERKRLDTLGQEESSSQSKFNMTEAKKIVEIAEKLVCHYRVPTVGNSHSDTYSAQKEAIRSEYGVVLLSTVRSRRMMTGEEGETADIGWIRKNLGFVADPHRICVGITRSKFGLVIVGNENVLKYDRIWKKLIEHYRKGGCFVRGDDFPH